MRLLAIDTAAEACSAALLVDGEVQSRYLYAPRQHGELILSLMDQLLVEAGLALRDLDALAFGRGPGAFTGVRIATGVVQGAAFGADLPVVAVSNLAALAQRHFREQGRRRVLAAFDARMGEVYWGAFAIDPAGLARPQGEEQVALPAAVVVPEGGDWHGAGSGWGTHVEALRLRVGTALASVTADLLCHAQDVALLGAAYLEEGGARVAEQALPVYLRDQVAWKKST
jgi:tRNA threonylcarbamoyladenosine biosynthesis protein TsaB